MDVIEGKYEAGLDLTPADYEWVHARPRERERDRDKQAKRERERERESEYPMTWIATICVHAVDSNSVLGEF